MHRMNRAACTYVALAFCAINATNAQQNPPRADFKGKVWKVCQKFRNLRMLQGRT
jgi:hypothetical protein